MVQWANDFGISRGKPDNRYDDVYTVNDLLIAAADALNDCDLDRLEQLKALIDGWLQADDETQAQLKMLDAMIGACDAFRE